MNSRNLNDWLQLIGIFGVIASLIFVGLQLKQSHEISLSAAYQARADTSINLNMTGFNTPEYTSAAAKVYARDYESMTPGELVAYEYYLGASITMYENQHQQFLMGFLPEEHWSMNLAGLRCLFSLPLHRNLLAPWNRRPSFQALIDEIREDAIANPEDCWGIENFHNESLFE